MTTVLPIDRPFSLRVDESDPNKVQVFLSGAFRRGNIPPEQLHTHYATLSNADRASAGTAVIFNVSDLSYWDTLGINAIIPLVEKINTKHQKRAGIVGDKESNAYRAAYARHKQAFSSGRILWEETVEALMARISI